MVDALCYIPKVICIVIYFILYASCYTPYVICFMLDALYHMREEIYCFLSNVIYFILYMTFFIFHVFCFVLYAHVIYIML